MDVCLKLMLRSMAGYSVGGDDDGQANQQKETELVGLVGGAQALPVVLGWSDNRSRVARGRRHHGVVACHWQERCFLG